MEQDVVLRFDMNLVRECVSLLQDVIEHFDNRKVDRWLDGWEKREMYSLEGMGSFYEVKRPHFNDPAVAALVRADLLTLTHTSSEATWFALRILPRQRPKCDAFIDSYLTLLKQGFSGKITYNAQSGEMHDEPLAQTKSPPSS